MTFFVRAVVTGFGLSLGAALFKKVQHRVPWLADPDPKKPDEADALTQEGGSDLQQ
jgi:hypothetical protein